MVPRSIDTPIASAAELEGMLRLSRPKPSDALAIVGPHSLENITGLCQRGFDHVSCLCTAAPRSAFGLNDVLFVGGPLEDEQLVCAITAGARTIADGGSMVIHLKDIDQDRVAAAALQQVGLAVRSTVFDLSRDVLVSHRLSRSVELERAA